MDAPTLNGIILFFYINLQHDQKGKATWKRIDLPIKKSA